MTTKNQKEEYLEWLKNPITLEFKQDLQEEISDLKEQLAISAGLDPIQDRFMTGCIAALSEAGSWKPESLYSEEEE